MPSDDIIWLYTRPLLASTASAAMLVLAWAEQTFTKLHRPRSNMFEDPSTKNDILRAGNEQHCTGRHNKSISFSDLVQPGYKDGFKRCSEIIGNPITNGATSL